MGGNLTARLLSLFLERANRASHRRLPILSLLRWFLLCPSIPDVLHLPFAKTEMKLGCTLSQWSECFWLEVAAYTRYRDARGVKTQAHSCSEKSILFPPGLVCAQTPSKYKSFMGVFADRIFCCLLSPVATILSGCPKGEGALRCGSPDFWNIPSWGFISVRCL